MFPSPDNPDTDEHLPNTYDRDRIYLMMQSPNLLFLYWDFASDPRERLRQKVGDLADDYVYVVRIINLTLGRERPLHAASKTRAQWIEARPGTTYKALIGLYSFGLPIQWLLESNEVTTPRHDGGSIVSIPEDKISECYYILSLYQAGDVKTALELMLTRLDEKEAGEATRTIALGLSPIKLPAMKSMNELVEMRRSLISLYLGKPRRTVLNYPDSGAVVEWLTEIPTANLKKLPQPASLFATLYLKMGCADGRALGNLGRYSTRYSSYILFGSSDMLIRPGIL
jgi:Domain of unknown function (DUF4912)